MFLADQALVALVLGDCADDSQWSAWSTRHQNGAGVRFAAFTDTALRT